MPSINELINLYEDAKWIAYTNDVERLKNAIHNSLKVWTVWDEDKLVGLARVIGDDYTIIYIQDILVLEDYQNKGIGSKLLQLILEQYKSICQVGLMTDNTEKTIKFYEKNGMIKTSDYNGITFIKG